MRRRRPRIGPLTNISREPGAWCVHVIREGKPLWGHFADATYGGRRLSLVAAQRYRDDLLRRIEPDTRVRRRVPKGGVSKTGVVGVALERYFVDGHGYERYVAHWKDPDGRTERKRFSVRQHGKERAFDRAVEARQQGVANTRAVMLVRQREEAEERLAAAPPMPRRVKDPKSRKGMRMPSRRKTRPRLDRKPA